MKLKKLFLFCVALAFVLPSFGQSVPKPFTVRTSQYSPTRKIYNLPGDFALIGNTNMILNPYSSTMGNNNTAAVDCDISPMVYVDIDGDPNTVNSSSAQLVYSTENGSIPANTEVVYAGLYWMSRAEPTLYTHGDTIDHTYRLTVSKNSSHATYTLNPLPGTGGHTYTIVYTYGTYGSNGVASVSHSNSPVSGSTTVTIQKGSGAVESIIASDGNDVRYSYVTTSGSAVDGRVALDYYINDVSGHPLWVRFANRQGGIYIAKRTQKELSVVKGGKSHSLYENKIKFKHESEANYTTITATNTNIMYPNHQDNEWNGSYFLNVSYAEVTDYVRAHGVGNYFGADVCIKEGHDFQVGFTGGWGLVVVYQNPDMNVRDITIFDGYAIMNNDEHPMDVNINGFRALQSGDVNVKVAMMAAEGEPGLKGDICEMRKGTSTTDFVRLKHSHNSTEDFFNGSIVSSGSRNPSYGNNCGLDLVVFHLNNSGNSLIGNGQTGTTLRYRYKPTGGTQDVYVPFFFAIALDSYNSNPVIDDYDFDVELTTNCNEVVPDFTSIVLAHASTDCPLSTDLTVSQSVAAGTPVPRGTSVDVTVTVTDECGKTAQKVINVSAPNPEITCPPTLNKLLAFGDCVMTIYPSEFGTPTHSFGWNWTTVSNDMPADNLYAEGDHVITWTMTDKCGIELTCTQLVKVIFPACPDAIDCEGNVYHGVRIDCDCWTQRNLESNCYGDANVCVTTGNCADPIPCVYEYETPQHPDVNANVATFGKLYCDTAALGDSTVNAYGHVRGICPEGWYLPTPEKYEQLNSHGADALKSPLYWTDGGGSNTTDFTWLPAGWYNGELGRFEGMLSEGYFWSTKVVSGKVQSSAVEIFHDCDSVIQKESHSGLGYSVRCIKEKD